ncbi:ATP-binding cassette domain-containing protein [Alistipes sp.]|uniref:ATP-binding cassette domain-containing protein n=1 Tax=Alistipes sp. TaxID=1872444 RepID=UPI0025C5D0B6|nr:ATP-binding cassette domain-containing protein [Alistipes sp.]
METIELKGVMPAAFAADPLSVRHSDVWLRDVVFRKGAFYLVEAVSGAGKTSLCSYLYGMRSDYSGEVLFDGCDIRRFSRATWGDVRRRSLSVLFQDLRLFEELTVAENIALKNDLTHFQTAARIGELLEEAGLAEKRTTPVGRLSFGQQQRVAFVRALCQPFDFMLLDEPVSHLDAANGRILARLLTDEARRQGAGVLVTSVGSRLEMSYDHLLHL